jgi:hypothetical protein
MQTGPICRLISVGIRDTQAQQALNKLLWVRGSSPELRESYQIASAAGLLNFRLGWVRCAGR